VIVFGLCPVIAGQWFGKTHTNSLCKSGDLSAVTAREPAKS
jgi:hypothetical protein